MTPSAAIAMADRLKPNMMTAEDKYRYLNEIEGKVFHEILLTHVHDDDLELPVYEPPTDPPAEEDEMLAPAPYDMLYVYWIMSQIDHLNQEMDKYNNDRALFENAWGNFADYWNRNYMPLSARRFIQI